MTGPGAGGTALMQAALDLADNWLGLTRVELTVWADNQAALAPIAKAGFVEEGVARDYGLRHGVLVDAPLHGQGAPMIDYRERLTPVLRALEQDPDLPSRRWRVAPASPLPLPPGVHRRGGRPWRDVPPPADAAAAGGSATPMPASPPSPWGGLGSSQAFAKAFRRHYGCTRGVSPRQGQERTPGSCWEGHAWQRGNPGAEGHSSKQEQHHEHRRDGRRTLAYIRVTGPYGEGYDAVCHRLHQWAAPRGLEEESGSSSTTTTRGDAAGPVPHRHRHQRTGGDPGSGRWRSSTSPPDATPSPATSSRIAASTGALAGTSAISSRPGRLWDGPASSSITA